MDKTVGFLKRELVFCGKSNCKCSKDKRFKHGPYYFHFYRQKIEGGRWKLRKEYVPRAKLGAFRKRLSRERVRRLKQKELTVLRFAFGDTGLDLSLEAKARRAILRQRINILEKELKIPKWTMPKNEGFNLAGLKALRFQ